MSIAKAAWAEIMGKEASLEITGRAEKTLSSFFFSERFSLKLSEERARAVTAIKTKAKSAI